MSQATITTDGTATTRIDLEQRPLNTEVNPPAGSIEVSGSGILIDSGYGPIVDFGLLLGVVALIGVAYYAKKRIDLYFVKKSKENG